MALFHSQFIICPMFWIPLFISIISNNNKAVNIWILVTCQALCVLLELTQQILTTILSGRYKYFLGTQMKNGGPENLSHLPKETKHVHGEKGVAAGTCPESRCKSSGRGGRKGGKGRNLLTRKYHLSPPPSFVHFKDKKERKVAIHCWYRQYVS